MYVYICINSEHISTADGRRRVNGGRGTTSQKELNDISRHAVPRSSMQDCQIRSPSIIVLTSLSSPMLVFLLDDLLIALSFTSSTSRMTMGTSRNSCQKTSLGNSNEYSGVGMTFANACNGPANAFVSIACLSSFKQGSFEHDFGVDFDCGARLHCGVCCSSIVLHRGGSYA